MVIIFDDKDIERKKKLFKNNQFLNSFVGGCSIKWNVVFQWACLVLDWNYEFNFFFHSTFFSSIFCSPFLALQWCLLLFIFYVEGLLKSVCKALQECQMLCWKLKDQNQIINHDIPYTKKPVASLFSTSFIGFPFLSLFNSQQVELQCLTWYVYFADSEQSTGSDTEVLAERTSCSFGSHSDLTSGGSGPQPPPPSSMEEIQVELQCADLWKRFHDIGTEMIITKAGR